MQKDKVFVFGDVHGELELMQEMLEHWNEKDEQLVILGDLADRGPNSKGTIELAYQLVNEKEAILIKGNHDEMLENYLENPAEHQLHYYMNGGESTLKSLLGDKLVIDQPEKNAERVKKEYPWLLSFLKSLDYFYEWEDYFFVHAGVDLTLKDWRNTTDHDLIWIRQGFFDQKNTTGKTIIFGHTVTSTFHDDLSNFDIWKSGDGLIGIDGGAVYGGKLHALRLSKEGIKKKISIDSKN